MNEQETFNYQIPLLQGSAKNTTPKKNSLDFQQNEKESLNLDPYNQYKSFELSTLNKNLNIEKEGFFRKVYNAISSFFMKYCICQTRGIRVESYEDTPLRPYKTGYSEGFAIFDANIERGVDTSSNQPNVDDSATSYLKPGFFKNLQKEISNGNMDKDSEKEVITKKILEAIESIVCSHVKLFKDPKQQNPFIESFIRADLNRNKVKQKSIEDKFKSNNKEFLKLIEKVGCELFMTNSKLNTVNLYNLLVIEDEIKTCLTTYFNTTPKKISESISFELGKERKQLKSKLKKTKDPFKKGELTATLSELEKDLNKKLDSKSKDKYIKLQLTSIDKIAFMFINSTVLNPPKHIDNDK